MYSEVVPVHALSRIVIYPNRFHKGSIGELDCNLLWWPGGTIMNTRLLHHVPYLRSEQASGFTAKCLWPSELEPDCFQSLCQHCVTNLQVVRSNIESICPCRLIGHQHIH